MLDQHILEKAKKLWDIQEELIFVRFVANTISEQEINLFKLFYDYRVFIIFAFCKDSLKPDKVDRTSHEWMKKTIDQTVEFFNQNHIAPFFKR